MSTVETARPPLEQEPPPVKPLKRTLLAGMAGNVMEWYDFGLFGYFAPVMADLFFPAADPTAALLATFSIFASGFLMRPVGAAVFGHFGDRFGRRKTLAVSVILMAVPTCLIGLLPTYAEAGETAAVLLTLLRLLQGFSVGGEYTGSITFLVEHADRRRRGLIGSLPVFSATLGILLGSGIGALLTRGVDKAVLEDWAWRLPFLFGIAVGGIGLYLRMGIEETPSFRTLQQSGNVCRFPLAEALRHYRRELLTVVGLLWLQCVAFYIVFVYLTTYLSEVIGMSFGDALTINTLSMVLLCVLIPLMGALSDRVGRRPTQLLGATGFLSLSYPLFALIARGDFTTCLFAQCVFAVMLSAIVAPQAAMLVEIFATRARYTAQSLGYNVAQALFGGTAPLAATYLIDATGSKLAPGLYLTLCAAVTLGVVWNVRETYREALR
jgi:MHS family proline/betaine transporter-like MFS transporter